MKFVVYPAVEPERLKAMVASAPTARWVNATTESEAEDAITGAEAFLGKITPAILARADQLAWVQAFTASLEHYMFPQLRMHPSVLTNMRGLFGDVIADQVMGYILCFARNLHMYVRQQVNREYEPVGGESGRVGNLAGPAMVSSMDRATIFLPGSNLGVVGMGGIGLEVARRAMAFGMKVKGVDRFPDRVPTVPGVLKVESVDRLPELLAWSDFAVIAAPETPETRRLFNASMIAHLRPTSYLINVGRGAIVVLDDLTRALARGELAGAALDVFEVEPLPADHLLWSFPNVIITPHTAGYSPVIAGRHLAVLVDNVRRFARGEPLLNRVDKTLWF